MSKTIDIKAFFSELFNEEKAEIFSKQLHYYNIQTAEQLYGVLNPILPQFSSKELKAKGLSASYTTLSKKRNTLDKQVLKVKKVLKIKTSESKIIVEALNKHNFPLLNFKPNKSVYSLGLKESSFKMRTSFWSSANFKERGLSYIIPDYDRIGTVYDQGTRGTCVANTYCALFNYTTGEETSRQFLYHQCKMTDGIKNEPGTYMHIPVMLITEKSIIDFGVVNEREWPYNRFEEKTEHQGTPPENCFNTLRFYSEKPIKTRKENIVEDIKNLLRGSNIHRPIPVAIGLKIFESFNNIQSASTGWITMPLPGERAVGGHAMLIVGYFDEPKLFLVRNSWGTGWAPENPYGYPGHALIPYQYIERYSDGGWSFLSIDGIKLNISEPERLYNNNFYFNNSSFAAALKITKGKTKNYSRRNKISNRNKYKKHMLRNVRLKYFLYGIIVTLLIIYHKEIADFIENIMHWLKKH